MFCGFSNNGAGLPMGADPAGVVVAGGQGAFDSGR